MLQRMTQTYENTIDKFSLTKNIIIVTHVYKSLDSDYTNELLN